MSRRISIGYRSPRTGKNDEQENIYDLSGRINQDVLPDNLSPIVTKQPNTPGNKSRKNLPRKVNTVAETDWSDTAELERKYDLTPVANPSGFPRKKGSTPSYTIDPFEFSPTSTQNDEVSAV